MRRLVVLALAAAVVLLCACGERAGSRLRTVEYGGRAYEVDQENQTISFDGVVCAYSTDGSGKVTFTAPNGAIAYWQQSGGIGHGGWSEDWEEAVGPGDLMNALKSASGSAGGAGARSGNPLLGLLLLAVGAFNALAPGPRGISATAGGTRTRSPLRRPLPWAGSAVGRPCCWGLFCFSCKPD